MIDVASTAKPAAALEATALSIALDTRAVLHDIDVSIPSGCWASIVGPNGAGKSTLLKALAGLLKGRGEVRLHGKALHRYSARQRACRLSWLGQNESVAEDLSVYDVVMLGRLPHQAWLATPSAADHLAVAQALSATQAWDWRERPLGQLSGGERQRVLLARVLSVQADVVLMDEPVSNLDPPHQADWLALVRQLIEQGKTVVSVLHELSLALMADQLIVLEDGRILTDGLARDPQTHRAVERVFQHRVSVELSASGRPTVSLNL